MSEQFYSEILREHGLKATVTRLRILELLSESKVAMSHSEISDCFDNEKIDKVTLYRTLNAFVECGIAHKVANEDRNWLYAIFDKDIKPNGTEGSEHKHEHAHFICSACDKIYCFPVVEEMKFNKLKDLMGFKIDQHEIRLHGTCPVCQ
ncbi:MAG: transcriptional repressor [Balneolales bacterium]|nr:transcriptional repressor [Balneolales bacterium]